MTRSCLGLFALLVLLGLPACGMVPRWLSRGKPAPVDLNTASVAAIGKLPGITPTMAGRIAAGRPYGTPETLVERRVLSPQELERIRDRVVVAAPAS
jgi:hypothetical protein